MATAMLMRLPVLRREGSRARRYIRASQASTARPVELSEPWTPPRARRPTRVTADFFGEDLEVSLVTGRAIGHPDWVLSREALRELRAAAWKTPP